MWPGFFYSGDHLDNTDSPTQYRPAQRYGLILGGLAFFVILQLPVPSGLGEAGLKTAAVAVLMAVWWMTEAIPIPATALLPLVLFPFLDVLDASTAAAPYAHDLIFLFMGGFLLAVTMERWGLHKRIALRILQAVGTTPNRVVLGFMIATAFLSMWISNTATAAMMLPIAIAVGELLRPSDQKGTYNFGLALMLGMAYGASIGGVATLIGTPPNAVLAGAASEILDIEIGFVQWMGVCLPITLVMLPITWLMLTRILYPPGDLTGDAGAIIEEEARGLGPMSDGETRTAIVFVLAVMGWLFRSEKDFGAVTLPGLQTWAPNISDSTVAMTAAVLLFLIPVNWKRGDFVLDWKTAKTIPWGILVLFGGGLSLARAMLESGLSGWIGSVVAALGGVPTIVIVAVIAGLIVFLTEVTSNTATSTMAMPIMAGAAIGLGMEPLLAMAAAALGASMAFMLPVATPPNAIVFGSGYVSIQQMSRAGFWLNLIAIGLITVMGSLLVPAVLI